MIFFSNFWWQLRINLIFIGIGQMLLTAMKYNLMHKNKRTPRAGQTDQLLPETQLATVLLYHFYLMNRYCGM